MKKTLLLVQALITLASVGCGPDNLEPSNDPSETLATSKDELSAQGCTPLTAQSVLSSGNDGNVPQNTLDDQMGTRWSNFGKGSWIDYDLGSAQMVSGVAVAWHQGDQRANLFAVSTSTDGITYTPAYTGTSTGTTTGSETYTFTARTARRVRLTFQGNTQNDWASVAEARVCGTTASSAGSGVVWRGDFESGSLSQWSSTQMVSADRLQVVSSPARQGSHAIKVTVKQGDNPINASGNRNELVRMTNEKEGDEYFYRWSTMFASDFPSEKTWQLFTQWHQSGDSGSPPVEFYVNGETVYLRVQGSTVVWSTPLVRGQWHDFIFHVKWSAKSGTGFVELYYDGNLVLPKKNVATLYSGMTAYLKVGLYRNNTISKVGVVYHDAWVQGRSLQDVQ